MLEVKFGIFGKGCFVVPPQAGLLAMTVVVRLTGINGEDCLVAALLAMTVVVRLTGINGEDCLVAALLAMTLSRCNIIATVIARNPVLPCKTG